MSHCDKTVPAIWFIHGAGGSQHSFTWLSEQLPHYRHRFFSYQVTESVDSCVERLGEAILMEEQPPILIGHSLGGIIGRACAKRFPVNRLVTLCAPFGGMLQADIMSWFTRVPLFHELRRFSPHLVDIRLSRITAPHLAIVGTHGLPFTNEPNDGVGTVESQMAIANQRYVQFPLNHFEVLLSTEVAAVISDFVAV